MEIKVVPVLGKTGSNRSKYFSFLAELFTEQDIENLKQSLEQVRGNPTLGVMVDISGIKSLSDRKNKISERGYITNDGQIRTYGTIAKALAALLHMHGIKDVYFVIKEYEDKVYVTFRDLQSYRALSVME